MRKPRNAPPYKILKVGDQMYQVYKFVHVEGGVYAYNRQPADGLVWFKSKDAARKWIARVERVNANSHTSA